MPYDGQHSNWRDVISVFGICGRATRPHELGKRSNNTVGESEHLKQIKLEGGALPDRLRSSWAEIVAFKKLLNDHGFEA